jgi:hypothetical protein
LLLTASPAFAQRGGRVSAVGNIGFFWPRMRHERMRQFDTKPALLGGAMINFGISDHAGVQFGVLVGEESVTTGPNEYNTMTLQELDLQFRWNILTEFVQPYLLLGGEYAVISLDPPLDDESDPGVNAGAGLELLFTDRLSVGVVGRWSKLFSPNFETAEMWSGLATVAFTF